MQLKTGSLVGSYEIVAPLGAGGMGEVYRARDPRLGREVAIKVLPSSFADNADRLRRFQQEARAAGILNHPNLLTVFELGTCDGAPFIVSELIEGWTLREVLSGNSSLASSSDVTVKGALPVRRGIDFAVQLANGLAAAHDKGIIHRDLKPENVLITADSRVKLLDFGLAKLLDDGPLGEDNTINRGTHPGVVLGTVAYMSPEQARGDTVDHRSDVFSLGSVLYEMLAGTSAFRRDTQVETMNAILKEDPKPAPSLPPALDRIVRHALEKNPAHRFQSMRDLAFALDTLTGSGESQAADKLRKGAAKKPVEKATAAVFHRLTFRRGFLMNARFAPDGSIFYGAAWDDQPIEIYSTVAGTRHSRAVGLPGADILSVSTTGEMAVSLGRRYLIGWVSSGTLARIPLFGGAPREICEDVQEAEWGPDGRSFLILRRVGESYRIEYPIGQTVYKSVNWMSHPRFSPKGDLIAFFDHPLFGDDRGSLVVIDLQGNERLRTDVFPSTGGLAWNAKGDEVWISRERAETGRDIVSFSLSGKERALLAAPGRYSLFDIARDGTVLLSFDYCRREIMAGKIGRQHDQNLSWFDWSFLTSITPDGSKIVFEEQGAFSRADGEYQIYVRALDGSPSISIGEGYGRAISADGKWVAAKTGTPATLHLLPTGAGDPRQIPLRGLKGYYSWEFTHDLEGLFILGNEPGHGNRVYLLDLSGDGTPRPLSPEGASAPMAVSPDGTCVLATGPDHRPTIYSVDGSEPRVVAGCHPGERPLAWCSDAASVLVTGQGRTALDIVRVDLTTGERSIHHTIRPADPGGIMDLSPIRITPDGQTFAYGYRRYLSDLFVVTGLR